MNEWATPSTNGRDGQGRFVHGNKAGKGNPLVRRVAAFRSSLLSAATPDQVAQLVQDVIADALKGDREARKLFFASILPYFIGSPQAFAESRDVQEAQRPFVFVFPKVGDQPERRFAVDNLAETGDPPS